MIKRFPKFYDEEKDLIQCQECGKWFKCLISHIPRIHKITCEQYKEKYGLFNGELINLSNRNKRKEYHSSPKAVLVQNENFYNHLKPFDEENKRRGKVKPRFKKIKREISLESKLIMSDKIKKYHNTPAGKERRIRACKTSMKGIYKECLHCHKKYYVRKGAIKTSKFCSRICQNNSSYIKEKQKEFWNTDKSLEFRKKKKIITKNLWESGKLKKGWKWKERKLKWLELGIE